MRDKSFKHMTTRESLFAHLKSNNNMFINGCYNPHHWNRWKCEQSRSSKWSFNFEHVAMIWINYSVKNLTIMSVKRSCSPNPLYVNEHDGCGILHFITKKSGSLRSSKLPCYKQNGNMFVSKTVRWQCVCFCVLKVLDAWIALIVFLRFWSFFHALKALIVLFVLLKFWSLCSWYSNLFFTFLKLRSIFSCFWNPIWASLSF